MRSADPADIDHPQLREFALQAVWVAQLEEATGVLEELMTDLADDEDQTAERAPWEADPLETAWSVVQTTFEEADQELEARVTEWLAQDPEHWPIFRLVVLDPWQEQPGRWREGCSGVGPEPRDQHGARALPAGSLWSATGDRLEAQ